MLNFAEGKEARAVEGRRSHSGQFDLIDGYRVVRTLVLLSCLLPTEET